MRMESQVLESCSDLICLAGALTPGPVLILPHPTGPCLSVLSHCLMSHSGLDPSGCGSRLSGAKFAVSLWTLDPGLLTCPSGARTTARRSAPSLPRASFLFLPTCLLLSFWELQAGARPGYDLCGCLGLG